MIQKILSLSLVVILISQSAFAVGLTCKDNFRRALSPKEIAMSGSPEIALRQLLQTDAGSVRAWRTNRKINKIDWDKKVSVLQLEGLVKNLFAIRFGEVNRYRDALKDPEPVHNLRVLRLTEQEMALNGLIRYFEDRHLLKRDSTLSKLKQIMDTNEFEIIMSATTFLSLTTPTPILRVPNLKLFKLAREDIFTLIAKGLESREGRAILAKTLPLSVKDWRYAIFRRTFNKLAFYVGVALITNKIWQDQEEEAEKNGKIFTDNMDNAIDAMEAKAKDFRNSDDITVEVALKNFSKHFGREPTDDDMVELCGYARRAKACAKFLPPAQPE